MRFSMNFLRKGKFIFFLITLASNRENRSFPDFYLPLMILFDYLGQHDVPRNMKLLGSLLGECGRKGRREGCFRWLHRVSQSPASPVWLPQNHGYDAAGETGNYCKVTLRRIQERWKNYNVDSRIRRLFLFRFTNSISQKSFICTKDLGLISLAKAELEYRYPALFLQAGKCREGRRAHGQGLCQHKEQQEDSPHFSPFSR